MLIKWLKILSPSILCSLFLVVTCKTKQETENIIPIHIERCDNCIMLEDFENYEINLGSRRLTGNNVLFSRILKWKYHYEYSLAWDRELSCFLRPENRNYDMNTLICYEYRDKTGYSAATYKYEKLVENEFYKLFYEEERLDSAGITYDKIKTDIDSLEYYFKSLTYDMKDVKIERPENFYKFSNQEHPFYYKDYEKIISMVSRDSTFTLGLNVPSFRSFNQDTKSYYFDKDVAIYATFKNNLPSVAFFDDSYTIEELTRLLKFDDYSPSVLQKFWDSLEPLKKRKYSKLRELRGEMSFQALIDSVAVLRKEAGI